MSLPLVETPARSYFAGMGQAVADRTVNRKIRRAFSSVLRHEFKLPRNDHSSLEDQLASFVKSEGFTWDGNYHVDHGDDVDVTGTVEVTGKLDIETWADVAERVSLGSSLLHPAAETRLHERNKMRHHLRQASLLMSGRHLQHGDETQPTRPMEVFTNCSTSALRCLTYRLLLNGSGVGTAYDDDLMLADLNNLPTIVPIIEWSHADVVSGRISGYMTKRDAEHLYAGRKIVYHQVADSREGWAKAVEIAERMAFEGTERETVLLLDFTIVRGYGEPIKGMQNRPASGPQPMMSAMTNFGRLRDAGMEPWRAAMYADHYLAECVLVGGARRAARMATKFWLDGSIFGFIQVKRGGFLWSSNNSVTADEDFRERIVRVRDQLKRNGLLNEGLAAHLTADGVPLLSPTIRDWFDTKIEYGRLDVIDLHAWRVLVAVANAAYHDDTGEPGLIMVDRLTQNDAGFDGYENGDFVKFGGEDGLDEDTRPLCAALARATARKRYKQITNPCGEISILLLGAYCVIADVVPFHAANDDDAEDAIRTATRALIRTNLMKSLYEREVKRTNRIGVGITGLHEWIFQRFGLGFRDIIALDPSGATMLDGNGVEMVKPHPDAMPMWLMLSRFARAVSDEARAYSALVGVTAPHTDRTIKPAGTTSKLFGLTEGAHLPSMREFIRWVQFRNDDPLVAVYEAKGYPVKKLKSYNGTTIVGFPTSPAITQLGMGDKLITAAEATMPEQMRYLRLLETFWIRGVNEDLSLLPETGNQVSYTAKYSPDETSYEDFVGSMIDGQFTVRCCSVMPQTDATAYEYQPETPVTKAQFEMIVAAIVEDGEVKEDIGFEHVGCSSGACPIDFREGSEAA